MSPPLIPPNGLGGPPPQDDLVYRGSNGGVPVTDDLVSRGPVDPITAALAAYGAPPGGAQAQIPVQPGLQPLSGGDDQGGPITDPSQLPPPQQYQPTTDAASSPVVPVQPPLASGDVRGAAKEQNAAVNAEAGNIAATELAKTNALATHADARAKIYEGHAAAQGLVDAQYQKAREAARQDANAETATWMRNLDQKVSEEPVASRWWSSQTKFGQVMYLMSLAFGALAQAKNPNLNNIALEMITKETEADMAEQRDRIKRQVDAMKLKGEVINQKLQAQIADSKDDHTLLATRLAMVQQAALERANAPGVADQKAAMAEAAQWAGQQRLTIAGSRADRAYAEREGQLNRDSENARALLTDKRDRDIAAATIQKDYDLARITADVKLAGKDAEKFRDTAVLHPDITGIRVVNTTSGRTVATPVSPTGGLVYNTKREGVDKELTQDSEMAQDRYATLRRVSRALGDDDDIGTLLKRNPQLVSDLQKLGYQQARENDPRGIVTDKDLTSGMESALGGDLNSLSGRIASGTFSAGQTKLKEVVDKAIRDMPAKMSNRFGARLDASIPGYEGNVRVDWTPRSVEIDEPSSPSTQQIDASYGIKTPVTPPKTIGELENAQALEKRGVQALPPYKPGSQDKVLKAIEDFKGAMPATIIERAGKTEAALEASGDQRAALEVQQEQYRAVKKANERLTAVEDALKKFAKPTTGAYGVVNRGYESRYLGKTTLEQRDALDRGEVPVEAVIDLAKAKGITQLTGQDVLDIIKRAGLKPYTE